MRLSQVMTPFASSTGTIAAQVVSALIAIYSAWGLDLLFSRDSNFIRRRNA